MIIKTVQKGTCKIDHVEYGDNVIYLYSSRNRQGFTITEEISRRITDRIMHDYTDEEYNRLLETVIRSARNAVNRTPVFSNKEKRSCRSCRNNEVCEGTRSCSEFFA